MRPPTAAPSLPEPRIAVRFLEKFCGIHGTRNADEVASLRESTACRLIALGVAKEVATAEGPLQDDDPETDRGIDETPPEPPGVLSGSDAEAEPSGLSEDSSNALGNAFQSVTAIRSDSASCQECRRPIDRERRRGDLRKFCGPRCRLAAWRRGRAG